MLKEATQLSGGRPEKTGHGSAHFGYNIHHASHPPRVSYATRDLMTRYLLCFLSAYLLSLSPAHAAVISRDWKTPGDGLLTYDTVNQREWLDLTETLSVPLPRYENVVAELDPGGMFEGFVVASQNDVISLVESAGIVTSTTDFEVNGESTLELIELLGIIIESNASLFKASTGQVEETFLFEGNSPHVGAELYYSLHSGAGLRFLSSRSDNFPNGALPVYLYRVVPEPNALIVALWAVLLSGLLVKRFQGTAFR